MIKSDYGHLGLPFYEQKLGSGLKVLFIPSKAPVESALVYISQGGYLHDEKIENSKIPFGTAYYVGKSVMDAAFRERLLAKGAYGEERSDLSYTLFQVTSKDDVFAPLGLLMQRLYDMDFKEESLSLVKKENALTATPLETAKKALLKNLYEASPIRLGVVPDAQESLPIHVTALRKFLQRYYVPGRVTLIVMGDYAPNECMEKIQALRLPKDSATVNKELQFAEDYKKAKVEYASDHAKDGNVLTFGIKFAPREAIYEKYGQLMFMAYEVLGDMLFSKNPLFLKGLRDVPADLLEVAFEEGGEDSCLLLSFRTSTPVALLSYLTDYLGSLDKKVERPFYSAMLDYSFARGLLALRNPHEAVLRFASAYANNIPYTSLLSSLAKMNHKAFKGFLKDISTYARSAYFLKKEQGE